MAKQQFNKIDVRYVSKAHYEMITNMFTRRTINTPIPEGEQHIFEMKSDGLKPHAFCGKDRGVIGGGVENTAEFKDRSADLPLCKKCETRWKSDPRSPWRAWVQGIKVK